MENEKSFKKWDFEKMRRLAKAIKEYGKKESANKYKYRESYEEYDRERILTKNNE